MCTSNMLAQPDIREDTVYSLVVTDVAIHFLPDRVYLMINIMLAYGLRYLGRVAFKVYILWKGRGPVVETGF